MNNVSEASVSSMSDLTESHTINNASTCSILNEYLNSIEVRSSDEESEDDREEELKVAIAEIDYYNPKPIALDRDIMEYWEEKKFVFPNLYQLAKVVHSVPATEVSVERAFSALRLVLTDLSFYRNVTKNNVS